MITLNLTSNKTAIVAAFYYWLQKTPKDFLLRLEGYSVIVTMSNKANCCQCRLPGFDMAAAQEAELRAWFSDYMKSLNETNDWIFSADGKINLCLKRKTGASFNFYINFAAQ